MKKSITEWQKLLIPYNSSEIVGNSEIIVHSKTLSFKCVLVGAEFALPTSKFLETFIPIGKDMKNTIIHTIKYTKKIDTKLI